MWLWSSYIWIVWTFSLYILITFLIYFLLSCYVLSWIVLNFNKIYMNYCWVLTYIVACVQKMSSFFAYLTILFNFVLVVIFFCKVSQKKYMNSQLLFFDNVRIREIFLANLVARCARYCWWIVHQINPYNPILSTFYLKQTYHILEKNDRIILN